MLADFLALAALLALGWLGLGSSLVYVVNIFRFHLPFSRTLVAAGVYDTTIHKRVLSSKWIGALVTLLLSVTAATLIVLTARHMGLLLFVALALGTGIGFFRSRHILSNQMGNICRFVRTHIVCMNRKKAAAFLKQTYDLELEKLVPKGKK